MVNQEDGTAEPAFNAAFRVSGEEVAVPEPGTVSLLSLMLLPPAFGLLRLRKSQNI